MHVAVFHHAGDTVSGPCLGEMVTATEARLGCRPRRRTELVRQRIELVEAQISQKQAWIEAQRAIIRTQVQRQFELGNQLQALRRRLTELEASYAGKKVRPTSRLAQARQRKSSWERQLGAALAQENQARRAIKQHQPRLEALTAKRARLIRWSAHLEVDNATCPNPVRIRWLRDGGFGDAANVTYLIEMGYELYVMAHNGKTTQALLKQLPSDATWGQAGVRTQSDGPYAGIQIRLDGPFAYQFPMPLFQTWTQLWPVSSESVKERLVTITATETLPSLAETLFCQVIAHRLEKVSDFELVERLPP